MSSPSSATIPPSPFTPSSKNRGSASGLNNSRLAILVVLLFCLLGFLVDHRFGSSQTKRMLQRGQTASVAFVTSPDGADDSSSTSTAPPPVSSTAASSSSFDVAQKANLSLSAMVECGSRLADGVYWSYESKQCLPIPGFRTRLRDFEAGTDELSCRVSSGEWVKFGFWSSAESSTPSASASAGSKGRTSVVDPDDVIESFGIQTVFSPPAMFPTAAERRDIKKQYSRFMFWSSWMFKQWKKFKPHVQAPTPPGSSPHISNKFRAFHDPAAENLMRVENFCVDPLSGVLRGYRAPATAATSADDKKMKKKNADGEEEEGVQQKLEVAAAAAGGGGGGGGGGDGNDPQQVNVKILLKNPKDAPVRYYGQDDGRGFYHNEYEWRSYFENVRSLETPPRFFDERPVIFASSMHKSAHNLAHTTFKFMSIVAMATKMNLFSQEKLAAAAAFGKPTTTSMAPSSSIRKSASFGSEEEETFPRGELQREPLVVFVLHAETWSLDADTKRSRVYGFMFRILDLPFAVALSSPGDASNVQHVAKMMAASRHPGANLVSGLSGKDSSASSSSSSNTSQVCFRHGVVYQSCYSKNCFVLQGDGKETYNFANYDPINKHKSWMMAQYRMLVDKCLDLRKQQVPAAAAAAAATGAIVPAAASTTAPAAAAPIIIRRRPRIFFSLRTRKRAVWFSGLFIELFEKELLAGGFADVVTFRELWKSSRAEYVEQMRQSDIFVGTHGGQMVEAFLLADRPVVVEVTGRWSYCGVRAAKSANMPISPRCWFGPSVDGVNGSHWILEFSTFRAKSQVFRISWAVMLETVKQAVCRWHWVHNEDLMKAAEVVVQRGGAAADGGSAVMFPNWCFVHAPPQMRNESQLLANPTPTIPLMDRAESKLMFRSILGLNISLEDAELLNTQLFKELFPATRRRDTGSTILVSRTADLFGLLLIHFVDRRFKVVRSSANRAAAAAATAAAGGKSCSAFRPIACLHFPVASFDAVHLMAVNTTMGLLFGAQQQAQQQEHSGGLTLVTAIPTEAEEEKRVACLWLCVNIV